MGARRGGKLEHWQIMAACVMVCDFVCIHLSYFLALWLRFDCRYNAISHRYLDAYFHSVTVYAVGAIILFTLFRMYRIMWRYASLDDLVRSAIGSLIASVIYCAVINICVLRMPLSYDVWGSCLQMAFVIATRFSFRLLIFLKSGRYKNAPSVGRVMVIGAGDAGQLIMRDIKTSDKITDKAVCIIDDNSNKWGRYIDGVPIVGGREEILKAVEDYKVTKIFLAIPSLSAADKKEILGICNEDSYRASK